MVTEVREERAPRGEVQLCPPIQGIEAPALASVLGHPYRRLQVVRNRDCSICWMFGNRWPRV